MTNAPITAPAPTTLVEALSIITAVEGATWEGGIRLMEPPHRPLSDFAIWRVHCLPTPDKVWLCVDGVMALPLLVGSSTKSAWDDCVQSAGRISRWLNTRDWTHALARAEAAERLATALAAHPVDPAHPRFGCPECGSDRIEQAHHLTTLIMVESWDADGTPNATGEHRDIHEEIQPITPTQYWCRGCQRDLVGVVPLAPAPTELEPALAT